MREEERKIAQDAKLQEEAQERNRIIDRSPYKKEWDRYRELIRAEIKHQSYMTWFTGLYIDELSDGQVTLNVPHRFMADFIGENYDKLLRDIFQRDVKLQLESSPRSPPIESFGGSEASEIASSDRNV